MKNERIEAILLTAKEYREHDMLVQGFSEQLGKFSLVVKGVLKPQSKNAQLVQPFCTSELILDVDPQKTIFSLKSGRLKQARYFIREDLNRINVAQCIAEITVKTIEAGLSEESADIYADLSVALDLLQQAPLLALAWYCGSLLKILGVAPVVDACVHCGSLEASTIDVAQGGFLCGQCTRETMPLETLKAFRWINKANREKIGSLVEQVTVDLNLVQIFVAFIEHYCSIKLTGFTFLKSTYIE